MDEELKALLAKRDALFRNPTEEAAREYIAEQEGRPPPAGSTASCWLAVHKARLQWLEATDAMIEESTNWLLARGFLTTFKGAPALTPERRDADRVTLGKPPLTTDS